ncbi:MAG TPA: hypothetical protein DEG17_04260 [Cyanobacteria bacterium UBA11149]|nr:hypothetical protein [Cyanobacteria bacterium UBA11367]HBE58139.1 hypothetical protein [Cyanobacteria bacterium UBA11366]HBK63447.1 hypothetical protein [Cyanobacteria bacterium UBA11166]HBR72139.1 hypothetical protein [Cyanobacteria bacterium UBA11159]HBS72652.1 hypothetical protein [Cyanobacteria bacterium UBA11153]HBW88103.1 hypothetical protein [Cyanobacteria bacterium UBA11149]HCA97901.1 hypothetical protein [Cyanobacteria bacterium UBA9226]
MKKTSWFSLILQLKGSVVTAIIYRVIGCGLFGVLITVLYQLKLPVSQPSVDKIITSLALVLGLLLVFRTNTAYERFWEGRKCWGSVIISIRNLSRQIWTSVLEKQPEDRAEKEALLRLLLAFSLAMKLHLRSEPVNEELVELMSQKQYDKLKLTSNPPLEIIFWIGDYFQIQSERNCLDTYQMTAFNNLLNNMVEALSGCERILKTPIPLAYVIHLKQLILIFCLILPFQMVAQAVWLTGLIVALISFALFGIEEIGIEIENPFGRDANDLPLDGFCDTIRQNIEDLTHMETSTGFKG